MTLICPCCGNTNESLMDACMSSPHCMVCSKSNTHSHVMLLDEFNKTMKLSKIKQNKIFFENELAEFNILPQRSWLIQKLKPFKLTRVKKIIATFTKQEKAIAGGLLQ